MNGTDRLDSRLLVNTIPKSGTYLVGGLLRRLGAADSGLHFRDERFWAFGGQPEVEVIADPDQFVDEVPFDRAVRLVGPGQFAVAHLSDPASHIPVLDELGIGVVFLVRDLRSCLVSNMRFLADPRRRRKPFAWSSIDEPPERFRAYLDQHADRYLSGVRAQLGWLDVGRPVIRFEELYGDHGSGAQSRAVAALVEAAGLDVSVSHAIDVLTSEVIGASTRTYSGRRSQPEEYWSDDADRLLGELGVPELNRLLGYAGR